MAPLYPEPSALRVFWAAGVRGLPVGLGAAWFMVPGLIRGWLSTPAAATAANIADQASIPLLVAAVAASCVLLARLRQRLAKCNFLLCPQCGYELSEFLRQGRCPECGRRVDLVEVQAAWRRVF